MSVTLSLDDIDRVADAVRRHLGRNDAQLPSRGSGS
jgi:hypothetical protein